MTKQEIFKKLTHFASVLAESWVCNDAACVRIMARRAWRRYEDSDYGSKDDLLDNQALEAAAAALNSSSRKPWAKHDKAKLDRALSILARGAADAAIKRAAL